VIGLETLGLRMNRICSNARALADALAGIPGLKVNYPLLPGNPFKNLAKSQFGGKGGGILTFRAGSKEKAFQIINALHYAVRATSIGDTRTLVIHPESTLYIRSTKEQREAAGVYEDTVRVSVGIEDPEDLIRDFTETILQYR
jgi:O-acetylhomoserine (thiol)-lyase